MKYIAVADWNNKTGELEFFVFGHTESHYIINPEGDDPDSIVDVHFMYIDLGGTIYDPDVKPKNKRFDPGSQESMWSVEQRYIYDDFDTAKKSFFKQLFRE